MPVKHRTIKVKTHRITQEAQDAFELGDYIGLHRALGLKPWEPSPFDIAGGNPYGMHSTWDTAWTKVADLNTDLEALIAPPHSEATTNEATTSNTS
jgi:hypothetical protein